MRAREPYRYDEVAAAEVLRPLDPTEHNMERLNRIGCGAGIVYQTAVVRGALPRAAVEGAVRSLTRHAALGARVVLAPDGALGFVEDAAAVPEILWVDDAARAWPRVVEDDMNAGPVESHRGSPFRVFVVGAGDEHAVTLTAQHHLFDGVSSVALMGELLEQIVRPAARPRRALRTVASSFEAPAPLEHLARLEVLGRDVAAWAAAGVGGDDRRETLLGSLEELEGELLSMGDDRAWPRALLDVQRLLVQLDRSGRDLQTITADADPGPAPGRALRVSTGLITDVIGPEIVAPLVAEARRRGLRMHGVLGAAVLFAHAARQWARHGVPDERQHFCIASPVNLRRQFHPPLEDDDVRMAVEPVLTRVAMGPADGLWDVAARFGAAVTRDVERRRALGSWFRTERAMDLPLGGVPIPLVSNVGRVALPADLGGLELVALHAVNSTHGMFQMGMVMQTLGETFHVSAYHELPTVSRESMARLVGTVRRTLERASAGEDVTARAL